MVILSLFQATVETTNILPRLETFNIRDIGYYVSTLISAALILASIVFLIYLVWSAFRWLSSGGDKSQLEMARQRMTNAFIGLAILTSAFAVLRLIIYILGLPILAPIGPAPPPPSPPPLPSITPPPAGVACGAQCCGPIPCSSTTSPCQSGLFCNYATGLCDDNYNCLGPPIPSPTSGPPGSPCTDDSQCTGFCANNQDNDADGYYQAYTSGTGTCQAAATDCNDNNASVHPNQTEYFETAISGNNFDYDCADSDGDGDLNDKWPPANCQTTLSTYSCQATPFPDSMASGQGFVTLPECGQNLSASNWRTCVASHLPACAFTPGVYNIDCNHTPLCVTGDNCDWDEDQPCINWNIRDINVFTYDFPYTNMPCK